MNMRKSPDMCAFKCNAQYTHAFYANDAMLYMLHNFPALIINNESIQNKFALLIFEASGC